QRGYIEAFVLDQNFRVLEKRTVLKEDWHLSYPYVFEAEGEIWMLPEGYKSGRLTLYKAIEFPWRWQAEPRFSFPEAAIDATPYFH
ncbi:glucosamine inositolphosphorylceramide transferase family protein, partial [Rosenbergiella collisarenosi]